MRLVPFIDETITAPVQPNKPSKNRIAILKATIKKGQYLINTQKIAEKILLSGVLGKGERA